MFNFVLSIIGPLIFGLACWCRFSNWSLYFDSPNYGYTILYFTMSLGGFIFFTALMGMCGACKESRSMLGCYFVVVVLVLVREAFH